MVQIVFSRKKICSNLFIVVLVLISVNQYYANMVYIVPGLGEGTLQHFSSKMSVTDSLKSSNNSLYITVCIDGHMSCFV